MRKLYGFGVLALLVACGSPQKVLIHNNYIGATKTAKVMLLDSGKEDPATKKRLFNVFVRNCDIGETGAETQCKDTVILENVDPSSIY